MNTATNRLKAFLDEQEVKYVSVQHSPAYAASDVASSAHVARKDFAKTLIVVVDGKAEMLVMPATQRLLIHELREVLETNQVRLATEAELRAWFPDCEVGAMPPFGNLYGLPVHVAPSLAHEKEIAFNAGTHTEVIKLAYTDFDRLATPWIIDLVTA